MNNENICTRCKKREVDFSKSKKHCATCYDKLAKQNRGMSPERRKRKAEREVERRRIRAAERVASGLCSMCGKQPIINGRSKRFCETCLNFINQRNKKQYKENPQMRHKSVLKWYEKNPGMASIYSMRYARKHIDKARITRHNRRERIRNLEGGFTYEEWQTLCSKYDNKCLCCEKQKTLSVDHVIPIIKGGTGYITNIQPLCRSCNAKKGRKILDFRPFGRAILDWT